MNLTKVEKKLLNQIFDEVERKYERAGCNDFSLPATPENKKFLEQVIKFNYQSKDHAKHLKYLQEDYPTGRLNSIDSLVLAYLRNRIDQELK